MLINLICSSQLERILTEMLESRGLDIGLEAKLTLLERGFKPPEQGIFLVFDLNSLADLADFLDNLSRKPDGNKSVIAGRRQDSDKYELIPYEEIMYFEAERNYTYCVTSAANGKYRVKSKLYELEMALIKQGFVRIGKSVLVNIMNVLEIIPWFVPACY